MSTEELKQEFAKEVRENYQKYFPVEMLQSEGFKRQQCTKTGTYFWSTTDRDVCGEPEVNDGFSFFEDTPSTLNEDYIGVWKRFEEYMQNQGYTSIDRYPVAARWRDDTDFVQASIYDFQPWVVSGRVEPPANPLIVPQFCLRFNDIDNVGVTMSHNTGFVMIGQHAFENEWDQGQYLCDLLHWFTEGMGIPKDELVLHEDAWMGGGNLGPCIEFFSRGLELANQVYMMFEHDGEQWEELDLKVLDMGMGHERLAWFTKGEGTLYDATFPPVVERLLEKTDVAYDEAFVRQYVPHAALLNIDEVEDIDAAWKRVANAMDVSVKALRDEVEPIAALYSVAEHTRSLLVAISDGCLPGNVQGGHNLRTIYRRAQRFVNRYDWDVDLAEVCEWHAEYLQPLFPELKDSLDIVREVLAAEKEKYARTKAANENRIERIVEEGDITVEQLVELYDSHGIEPEDVERHAAEHGVEVDVPDNFYQLVTERHDHTESTVDEEHGVDTGRAEDTEVLYYDHYDYVDFEATVVDTNGKHVMLDRTAFYPTGGGQVHDTGSIEDVEVVDVWKQGQVIVHELEHEPSFGRGDSVSCSIDWNRRLQLAQHHTATHIVGGVAREVLGDHIWQAGAKKTEEKSRLDITHYENVSDEEVDAIQERVNEVIEENLPIFTDFYPRDVAEQEYGFSIYQGGAVPGREIRLVEIDDLDVQACGGTHVNTTGEVEHVEIIKSSKVQDGVVRLEYVAGEAARQIEEEKRTIVEETASLLGCAPSQVPGRAEELFQNWKQARKAVKKGRDIDVSTLELSSEETYEGDIAERTADILRTQEEHIPNTVERFLNELDEFKDSLAEERGETPE